MKKLIIFAACCILSWPLTTSAQKIRSANYRQTNGSDFYSSQSNKSANYDVTRDKNVKTCSKVSSKSIADKVKKADKKAKVEASNEKREAIKKEVEKNKNPISK